MSYPITAIDDIDADEADALKAVGIRTAEKLLEAAKSPKGRKLLSAQTDLDEKRLLRWANIADKLRIKGMPVVTTRGKGFEDVLVKQIEDETGLPATTSIRSAIRALAHLGVRHVAVVTPYPQELHQSALSFLRASGFHVVAEHTMGATHRAIGY